jgi:hypothetical protein
VNQLRADLLRFSARRIVRGAVIIAILIAIVAIAVPTIRGHASRPNTTPRAQIQVGNAPDGTPIYQSFGPNTTPDTRVDVGKSLKGALDGVGILMVFVGVVLGASFVGAEFHLGSLTSQLLYEPRRWRVHLAKAATVGVGCAAFGALLSVVVGALLLTGSELHGVMHGLDSSWWHHRGVQVVRVTAACGAAAMLAFAVAVITKRTSAAIVAFFVMYPFIGIVRSNAPVFGVLSRIAPLRGLFSIAIDPRGTGNGNGPVELLTRTNAGGIVLTVVWVVGLVSFTGWIFSRSEVR